MLIQLHGLYYTTSCFNIWSNADIYINIAIVIQKNSNIAAYIPQESSNVAILLDNYGYVTVNMK